MQNLPEQIQDLEQQISEMKGAIAALESPPDENIKIAETEPLLYLRGLIDAEKSAERKEVNRVQRLTQAKQGVEAAEQHLAELRQQERHHRTVADGGWEKLRAIAAEWQQKLDSLKTQFDEARAEMAAIAAQCNESERAIFGEAIGSGLKPRKRQLFEVSRFFESRWNDTLPAIEITENDDFRRVAISRQEHTLSVRQQRERDARLAEARAALPQPSPTPEQCQGDDGELVSVADGVGKVYETDD